MKYFKLVLCILALCLALCACGEDAGTTPMNKPGPSGTNAFDTPATKPSSQPIDPATHTHNFEAVVTPPTCTQQGYTTYTCACGDCYTTDQTAITEHDYQEISRVAATASEDGASIYTCAMCGDSYEEVLYATGSVGLEYEANDNGTYTVVGLGTCADAHVVIPRYYEGAMVTAVGRRAFYNCATIEEITIPETVNSIGTQVFYKCSALHTVYYNSTYSSTDNPFLKVENIKKVVFGGTKIPKKVCYEANNIEEIVIQDGVTSIGDYDFYGCSSLVSIIIPDSVTNIGDYAFDGCSSLANIMIPDGVTSIGDWAFHGCISLTSITIPDGVSSIGFNTFYECTNLASITIPDSITSIGYAALASCSNLSNITIPDSVTSIGPYAFYYCSSLTSLTIPDSVTSIGYYVFEGCNGLTHITIPDSITRIEEQVFLGCDNLTSITIPDSVTSIGYAAFGDSIIDIYYGGTQERWESISKDYWWDRHMDNYTIHCTDGDISK